MSSLSSELKLPVIISDQSRVKARVKPNAKPEKKLLNGNKPMIGQKWSPAVKNSEFKLPVTGFLYTLDTFVINNVSFCIQAV